MFDVAISQAQETSDLDQIFEVSHKNNLHSMAI
jgi:hypothetical protein